MTGPTGLTPSQRRFLDQDLPERHHWNDASFLLSLQRPLDLTALTRAIAAVLDHHDALRLRFALHGSGWQSWIADFSEADPLPFSVHELAHLDTKRQRDTVTEISDRLQSSLDLRDGPVLRLAYFDLGERPHCLLFLAHWLAVDHYSARVVIEDLLAGYEHAARGDEPQLPPKTTSLPEWVEGLTGLARRDETLAKLDYWTRPEREKADQLAIDHPDGVNDLASLETVTVRLDPAATEALLRAAPRALGCDMEDLLCTSVARSVPYAGAQNGQRRLLLDLERHGRDLTLPGASVSRTVGRFSTLAPVLLTFDAEPPVEQAVPEVARALRQLPGAESYGLLRYLSGDARVDVLAAMPAAQVGLNYVGQLDEVFVRSDLLSVPRMSYGRQRSRVGQRFRELDVLVYVAAGRLAVTISFSTNRHDRSTIDGVAAALTRDLVALARAADPELPDSPRRPAGA